MMCLMKDRSEINVGYKKQILDASKSSNIQLKEIDSSIKENILMDIGEKYLINEMKFPLWERLNDAQKIR